MSKAEEKALEAYPSTSHYWNAESDRNAEAREFYKQGYHQAEKDLELTWKPSDEHIYALRSVVTKLKHSDNKYQEIIEDLYNDLKKLKGE